MKFSAILSIISLAIGIAIGWIAKPAPETTQAEVPKTDTLKISDRKEPAPSASPIQKSDRKATTSITVIGGEETDDMTDEQKAQIKKSQNMIEKMMMNSSKTKLHNYIAKLVAQLNLSPEQEASLRKVAEEKIAGLGSMKDDDFDPSQLGGLTGETALEDTLAEILTDEQKEEHEALKKRELANKIEATALKRLAKLSNLDMTQEQKDAAYDILFAQAEESTGKESPGNDIFLALTSGFGIEMDVEDLGLDFSVEDFSQDAKNGETPDSKKIMAQMKERQQQKIDKKVDALRPILNEAQLEQYRKGLDLKSQNILGSTLQGFGGEE